MNRLVIFHIGALLFCSQSFGNTVVDQPTVRQPGLEETLSLGRQYIEGTRDDWGPEDLDFGRQLVESVASQNVDLKSKAEALQTLKLLSSTSIELGLQYILGKRGKRTARDIKYGRQLLEREANQGFATSEQGEALAQLGKAYLEGWLGSRTEEDLNKGLINLQLASEQTNNLKAQALANALMGAHLIETKGKSDLVRKKAIEHLKAAAKQQNNHSAQSLAKLGLGQAAIITHKYKTALKRLNEVTEDNQLAHLQAQGLKGQLYASGRLGSPNKTKANLHLAPIANRELPQPDPTRKHLPPLQAWQKETDTILIARRKLMLLYPSLIEPSEYEGEDPPALETVQ